MAGGYGRGDQGRLVDRIDAALAGTAEIPRSPARHCFVDGEPALLVEWRWGNAGWEGRVISMVWADYGWATVERWLPSDQTTRSSELFL
jgi:hypothetical protein